MADAPLLTNYVQLIITLFGLFKQYRRERDGAKAGRPFTYTDQRGHLHRNLRIHARFH